MRGRVGISMTARRMIQARMNDEIIGGGVDITVTLIIIIILFSCRVIHLTGRRRHRHRGEIIPRLRSGIGIRLLSWWRGGERGGAVAQVVQIVGRDRRRDSGTEEERGMTSRRRVDVSRIVLTLHCLLIAGIIVISRRL